MYPLEHDLGARCVDAAVPTHKKSSLFRTENGTTATEKAASLLSRWMTRTVLRLIGSMIRMQDPQVPAGAFGLPNVSGDRSTIPWSILAPERRFQHNFSCG